MKNYCMQITWVLLLATILFQCTKNTDNPVGAEFFLRENWGSENFKILYSESSDTTYNVTIKTGSGHGLFVGQDANNIAYSLIYFTDLPDSGIVDSAKILLRSINTYGSNEGSFTASLHLVTQEWDEDLTHETFSETFIGDQIATTEIIAGEDSILFDIPPEIVNTWLDTTDPANNYGIIVKPTESAFFSKMVSREGLIDYGYEPVFKIQLHYSDDSRATLFGTCTKDVYIFNSQNDFPLDRFHIVNSLAWRSLFYFDFDSIPDGATINNASLILFADSLYAYPDNSLNFDLKACPITEWPWNIPTISYDETASQEMTGTLTSDSLHLDMTDLVQQWIVNEIENYGFVILGINQNESILRRAFFTGSADPLYRPRLEIYYSLPPSSRF